ncbi:hypothetical protein AB0N14_22830 [Streptomyces sp. NPDC051104]|uniref:hypothetical protein n=1 Tax=Streptomyces sp. NPDC051104 TaxID=3155044 RepID=UPI00343F51EF
MEGRDEARRELHEGAGGYAPQPGEVVYDHRWARELYSSVRCAVALLVMLLLIDWASGAATVARRPVVRAVPAPLPGAVPAAGLRGRGLP